MMKTSNVDRLRKLLHSYAGMGEPPADMREEPDAGSRALYPVDSQTMGDGSRLVPLAELQRGLNNLAPAPQDHGRLTLIVRRCEGGRREVLEHVRVSSEEGVPGDAWGRRLLRNAKMQIAVIQTDVATLIANGQPLT